MTDELPSLSEIITKIAVETGKEALNGLKEKVIQILKKRKYGVTVSKTEAEKLWEIHTSDRYVRLEECLQEHWALKLLNIGLYISYLNDKGEQKEIIERIKKDVYKEHHAKGVKILTISTTGVVVNIISYLSDLKMRKNLSSVDIGIELDKIIDEWEQITIFVKSEDNETKLRIAIVDYMRKRLGLFFVFAYGSASAPAYRIIAEMRIEDVFRSHDYMFFTNLKHDGYGLDVYSWSFELMEKGVVI